MRWVLCELMEVVCEDEEPDWSRVPESKRELVRSRWQAGHAKAVTSQVYLWWDQIEFFSRQYRVRILVTFTGEG